MDRYQITKSEESMIERSQIPIPNLPSNFIWMVVKPGSKIRNLITYASREFKKERAIVWTGANNSVSKAVTCAEIMKRSSPRLHQITKLSTVKSEDFWEPVDDAKLHTLKVTQDIPVIHILLSKDQLNADEPGYQAPGSFDEFWKREVKEEKKNAPWKRRVRLSNQQYAASGLQYNKRAEIKRRKNLDSQKEKNNKNEGEGT